MVQTFRPGSKKVTYMLISSFAYLCLICILIIISLSIVSNHYGAKTIVDLSLYYLRYITQLNGYNVQFHINAYYKS